MSQFENDLRDALQRREPPPGFANRVIARIPEPHSRFGRFRAGWLRPIWAPAMAAVLIAAIGAGSWEHRREEQRRQEALRAKAELVYALELTSVKLQTTRSRLFGSTRGSL